MATEVKFFTGKTKWCKVRKPDDKYDTYQVPLYMDETNLNLYKDSGMRLKLYEDVDGKYVVFKRKHAEFNYAKKEQVTNGPPDIRIRKGKEYVEFPEGLIGNGSIVTVKVEVFDTPKRGAGTKGHRLLGVAIEKLVEYNPDTADATGKSEAKVAMPF